ncbi:THRB-like protein [Mya arenaria]|uniref:THRB-like protein n=1 Tax=Mya arenaria TaxID=6604 RepID=A0ABY7DCY9_MYAAR|nr:THRB-like protein [Mya arenaria]
MKNLVLIVVICLVAHERVTDGRILNKDRWKTRWCKRAYADFKNGSAVSPDIPGYATQFSCKPGYMSNIPYLKEIMFKCEFFSKYGSYIWNSQDATLDGKNLHLDDVKCFPASNLCVDPEKTFGSQLPANMIMRRLANRTLDVVFNGKSLKRDDALPGEKLAFECLNGFTMEQKGSNPDPYDYHYNYEEDDTVDLTTELTCAEDGWSVFDKEVGLQLRKSLKTKIEQAVIEFNATENNSTFEDEGPTGRTIDVENAHGVDVYIVVDVSMSIDDSEYNITTEFIKALLPNLGINDRQYGTRIALYYFASTSQKVFNTHYGGQAYRNYSEAQREIDAISVDEIRRNIGIGTAITIALSDILVDIEVKYQVPSFRDAQQIIILISDGKYTQMGNPKTIADKIKEGEKAEIYSIALGTIQDIGVGLQVMKDIASDIDGEVHFFKINAATEEDLKRTIDYMVNPVYNGDNRAMIDTCSGDDGSPFVVSTPTNPSKYIQIGIVSYGYGCKRMGKYGFYTKLNTNLLEWIETTVKAGDEKRNY